MLSAENVDVHCSFLMFGETSQGKRCYLFETNLKMFVSLFDVLLSVIKDYPSKEEEFVASVP